MWLKEAVMKIKGLGLVFILIISLNLSAQSLFEEAEKGAEDDRGPDE